MLIQKFEEQVKKTPGNIAVKTEKRWFTYDQLNRYANNIAGLIENQWPKHEARESGKVGLFLEHGVDMIAAILGTLKAGKAYVPISPDYPQERVSYMLNHSEASLVITHAKCREKAQKIARKTNIGLLSLDKTIESAPISHETTREINGDRLAYIMYTSGSTGKPKGVMQNHENVLYYIKNWTQRFSITHLDRMTLFSSFCHDGSGQDMFGALLNGATLYPYDVRNRDDNLKLSQFLTEERISIWHSVPTLFNFFVTSLIGEESFADLRYILLGGEPFRGYEIEMFKKYFPGAILANVYGQTESSVNSIWTIRANDPIEHLIIGDPLDNTEIFVVDEEGNEVDILGTGEILIACPHISPGYWKDEDSSRKSFSEDPGLGRLYWTGDLGCRLPDGSIEFGGRRDFQVKIRGFRVELGEIETYLLEHEAVKEVAVAAKETQTGNYLYAYIVSEDQSDVSVLREYLAGKVPDYMIPTYFIQLEQMPLTQSGKIDRKALIRLKKEPLRLKVTYAAPETDMEELVIDLWREVLNLEKVGIHDNFFDLGGNSFDILTVNNKLGRLLGKDIPIAKMFKYPTVSSLAQFLNQEESDGTIENEINKIKAQKETFQNVSPNEKEIAVIGMRGRFPGAKTIDEFWDNLKNGIESIAFFSQQELIEAGADPGLITNPNFVRAKGVLEDIEYFDAAFFNYKPREAEVMSPQLRVFIECAWDALEHAGYDPLGYNRLISLYAGNAPNYYWIAQTFLNSENNLLGQFGTGLLINHFSTRVSYNLDLKGPSVSIQTACSTSLVAIHMACRGLLSGECKMALAGGITISLPSRYGYLYQEGLNISADGHCRTFDDRTNGTVFGDGVGIVVLKRLAEATADGDCIHAVIKGTAVNNDGIRKVGYTAPSVEGQAEVIQTALLEARVETESIGYIETHGTGTILGDPVEFEALNMVFQNNKKGTCAIGSVKTNIGHLNAAAGVTGFIKTVLSLKNKVIPPSLNFEIPNKEISLIDSSFYINSKLTGWEKGKYPLRAGVSSFGFGGTNAHVILEESPQREDSSESMKERLILLSAKTGSALQQAARNLAHYFQAHPGINLADAAYTLQVGRHPFKYRKMLVCSRVHQATETLLSPNGPDLQTSVLTKENPPVVFIFPGEETYYMHMGAELYQSKQEFRAEVDRCIDILTLKLEVPGKHILFPGDNLGTRELAAWNRDFKPIASFIIQYALARLVMNWGITPRAMMGEGMGEYVSACLSGVFSLQEALRLIAAKNRLNMKMPVSNNRFKGFEKLFKIKHAIFLQFSPDVNMIKIFEQHPQRKSLNQIITLVREPQTSVPDLYFLLDKIGRLWLQGGGINWQEFYSKEKRYRIPLPTYPFERQYYWIKENLVPLNFDISAGKSQARKKDIADWFYIPSWKRSVLISPGEEKHSPGGCWLVFQDQCDLGHRLINRLKQEGQYVITVKEGQAFTKVNEQLYIINPQKNNDYDALFEEFRRSSKIPNNIVHLWGVTGPGGEETDLKSVEKSIDLGFYSLIYLAQAIGKKNADDHFRITVITDHMQSVTTGDSLCPGKATIMGAVKVIPLEYTNIGCSTIDVVFSNTGNCHDEYLVDQLPQEFSAASPGKIIAYRGSTRWQQIFEPIRLEKRQNGINRLKENGIYLITGGLGGIGLVVAKFLAKHVHARLILIGRSPLPGQEEWRQWLETHDAEDKTSKKIKQIQEIVSMGADVLICKADVANQEEMQKAVASAEQRFGRINGVIHSAGLPDGCVIPLRTRENTGPILAAKVMGTVVLDRVLKGNPLDFFVICSSISSVLERFGQVAYCGANAFQDAFAHFKSSHDGIFATAIGWGFWKEVGMGVEALKQLEQNAGVKDNQSLTEMGISNLEGVEVFKRVLEYTLPHVVISVTDLELRFEEKSRMEITESRLSEVDMHTGTFYPRPELSTEYAPAGTEFEKVFAGILKQFFGYEKVGIHDNFFELGVTSITIIRINSLLREKLNKPIPMVVMFEYPTIALLGQYLEQQEPESLPDEELYQSEDLLHRSINLLTREEYLRSEP